MGKRYVVSEENPNVPVSVITSQAYLSMNDSEDIQKLDTLLPKHWMFEPLNSQSFGDLLEFPKKFTSFF